MELVFRPWKRFHASSPLGPIQQFLTDVGDESTQAFKQGNRSGKSGIHHYGLPRRSSAPGEYPARQSGNLDASIERQFTQASVTIGTTVFYARFLRGGTRFMARRKMSDNALEEGIAAARGSLRSWVMWKYGAG